MPIFEYKCEKCEGVTEFLKIRSDDKPPIKCEHCNSTRISKTISGKQSVKYKCSGFHATDYPTVRSTQDTKAKHYHE